MRWLHRYLLVGLAALPVAIPCHAQTITDPLYATHHPRLLTTATELPELQSKLTDGGVDDAIYTTVRQTVLNIYPTMSYTDVLGLWSGEQSIPCIGLVAQLENDDNARALGKALTLYLVDNFEPDNDEAATGMRLRALALGYDMCFKNATTVERGKVRDEIVRYIQKMVWTPGYQVFDRQPYLGNHSAMFGAALGLASIVLQGEADSYLLSDGLAMTDRIVDNLLLYQFDPNGAYNEGAFYAAWTLKQLVFYFDARHRFDGRAYTDNMQFRAIVKWFCYELSPEGGGRSFNINDSSLLSAPLAQHPTFFNWAMSAWNSGLASWLWQHTAGGNGSNLGAATDWTGTILWNRSVTPVEPGTLLPLNRVWIQRGLYYYRSGWPSGATSNDIVLSFSSGKFEGGHAQEDKNQFALRAYGNAFVIDHGAGDTAKESESHNMVFIDGKGQHNAGSSIGTDGVITDYILGDFADAVTGDATSAYTTYSEFNAPNYPLPGTDWSWGYSGANPVRFARRTVVSVHGSTAPFYALVMDDIDKDGATHSYEWRMHTAATNTVSLSSNPISIAGASASMDMHLLNPSFSSVTGASGAYNAGNQDPASTLIRFTASAINPKFTFLMVPRTSGVQAPIVTRQATAWGCAATLDWGGGRNDVVLRNDSGASVSYAGVTTDGAVAVVRRTSSGVESYMMTRGLTLTINGANYATFKNGTGSCEFASAVVQLNRYDADFKILNTGVSRVLYRDQDVGFAVQNGYVVPNGVTSVPAPAPSGTLVVHAWPNPFNPSTTVSVEGTGRERVKVVIYDVAGHRVRELWDGRLGASRSLAWDGRNDAGTPVSSGAYFVRVTTPSRTRTLKLTLLK
jgi:FlgD Ig-like domain/Heparinase II/III-like protein